MYACKVTVIITSADDHEDCTTLLYPIWKNV